MNELGNAGKIMIPPWILDDVFLNEQDFMERIRGMKPPLAPSIITRSFAGFLHLPLPG